MFRQASINGCSNDQLDEEDIDPNTVMVVTTASLMPMLTVKKEASLFCRAFKSPVQGHIPGISEMSKYKTLGLAVRRKLDFRPTLANEVISSLNSSSKDAGPPSIPLVLWEPGPDSLENSVPIEVDPMLTRWLREHQRAGVRFCFECLMGLRPFEGTGCILADDMGLGKTLQSITLMWTLLKQGFGGKPTSMKAVVVCPASLVKNWAAEIEKWLEGRCGCTPIAENCKEKVAMMFSTFKHDRKSLVLISSYETFRMHAHRLHDTPIDLVICDEAHRLKNDRTKTAVAIAKLPSKRRLLLSGTPIQNDLDEFYALASLANPDVLGDPSHFRKFYSNPIITGREPDALPSEQQTASERLQELSELTNMFILRRTNQLLAKVLPPKLILNVFCRLTPDQEQIYMECLQSSIMRKMLSGAESEDNQGAAMALASLQTLMKLCNHPSLLATPEMLHSPNIMNSGTGGISARTSSRRAKLEEKVESNPKNHNPILTSKVKTLLAEMFMQGSRAKATDPHLSGKFLFTASILKALRTMPLVQGQTRDRIVIISNFTQTLDLVQKYCAEMRYPVIRLDGSIGIKKRHELVTKFNDPTSDAFVFLLSSKAGGCGINLIGGNRLIMFDPDWNPANDKQALARVWRDGQKKKCFIYRLFSTGTIEEKIYQRQIAKDGLSAMIVADPEATDLKESFGADMLRDLFTYRGQSTVCDTHDVLECQRCLKAALAVENGTDPLVVNVSEATACAIVENNSNSSPSVKVTMGQPIATSANLQGFIHQMVPLDFEEDELLTWGHHYQTVGIDDIALRIGMSDIVPQLLASADENTVTKLKNFHPVSFCLSAEIDMRGLDDEMLKEKERRKKKREGGITTLGEGEEGKKITLRDGKSAKQAAAHAARKASAKLKGRKRKMDLSSSEDEDENVDYNDFSEEEVGQRKLPVRVSRKHHQSKNGDSTKNCHISSDNSHSEGAIDESDDSSSSSSFLSCDENIDKGPHIDLKANGVVDKDNQNKLLFHVDKNCITSSVNIIDESVEIDKSVSSIPKGIRFPNPCTQIDNLAVQKKSGFSSDDDDNDVDLFKKRNRRSFFNDEDEKGDAVTNNNVSIKTLPGNNNTKDEVKNTLNSSKSNSSVPPSKRPNILTKPPDNSPNIGFSSNALVPSSHSSLMQGRVDDSLTLQSTLKFNSTPNTSKHLSPIVIHDTPASIEFSNDLSSSLNIEKRTFGSQEISRLDLSDLNVGFEMIRKKKQVF